MKTLWLKLGASLLLVLVRPADAQFAGGDGVSASTAFLVATAEQLNSVRYLPAWSSTSTVYFRQIANINLSGVSNWNPISNASPAPLIHYDGGNFSISNLTISRSGQNSVGLFGDFRGVITSLTLSTTASGVSGNYYVGGFVGYLRSGSISDCLFIGNVTGNYCVGGFVGFNDGGGVYHSAYRNGNIYGETASKGGLIGMNTGGGRIESSFSAGRVNGQGGGLIGSNLLFNNQYGPVIASYWDTQVSGQSSTSGDGNGRTTQQMMQRATFSGWNFSSRWQLYHGKSYPYHRALASQVQASVLTPGSGTYPGASVTVTLTNPTPQATIHYTTGTWDEPNDQTATTVVSGQSVAVAIPGVLRAMAWVPYLNPSAVIIGEYDPAPRVPTPTATPGTASFPGSALEVSIAAVEGASVYYTLNESEPTESSTAVPAHGIISVPLPSTLKARAFRSDLNPSLTLTVVYSEAAPASAPLLSPNGGAFPGDFVQVLITNATVGALTRYTLDGTDPSVSSPEVLPGASVQVPLPGTLKARTWHPDFNPSAVATAAFTQALGVSTPYFDPAGGTFAAGSIAVRVFCDTPNAVIRYTTDGSEPTTASQSVEPGASVTVPVSGVLRAKAWHVDLNPSGIGQAVFDAFGAAPAPLFSPVSGPVAAGNVHVSLESTVPDAIIRYTTDGSTPTESSPVFEYGDSILVGVPGQLNARTWAQDYDPSPVVTAMYTTADVAPMPTFNPDGGTNTSPVSVTLGSPDSSAQIYYSLDGSDPMYSSLWVSPGQTITVTPPGTLRARAASDGLFKSPVRTASFGGFAGGSGTPDDPYQIATAGHLYQVRNHPGAHFVLVSNVDMQVAPWNSGPGWEPIGTSASRFAGTFDGAGYVITNLYINRPTQDLIGLFGLVADTGDVRNVGVYGSVVGRRYVGGLVGFLYGKLSNCFSYATAMANDSSPRVGGAVGTAGWGSSVENVYAGGQVSAPDGSMVGGFIGYSDSAHIINSYSYSRITLTATNTQPGGLIGSRAVVVPESSYWDLQASGVSVSDGGTGRTTAEMHNQSSYVEWDFTSVWRMPTNGYPKLRVFDKTPGKNPSETWLTRFYGAKEAAPVRSVKNRLLWEEYVAGTDPTDVASVFKVVETRRMEGSVELAVPSVPGRRYRVAARNSLLNGNWQVIEGLEADGTGGVLHLGVPFTGNSTYYRILVELAD
jgi:hypothetical protein